MKKLRLCCLSFFWMASCLGSEEQSSDEISLTEQPSVLYEEDVSCSEEKNTECASERTNHVFLEEKAAYFHPVNSKVRHIYGSGMGMYGVELTFPAWRYIYGWVSGSYLTKVGHSIGEHDRTRVQLVPLGIGPKFIYTVNYVDLYAGVGVLATHFHTRDHSRYVISNTSKWAAGGIAKIGVFIRPTKVFFIDFFGEYSYMKFNFHGGNKKVVRNDVNFSGVSVGGGIGWSF